MKHREMHTVGRDSPEDGRHVHTQGRLSGTGDGPVLEAEELRPANSAAVTA